MTLFPGRAALAALLLCFPLGGVLAQEPDTKAPAADSDQGPKANADESVEIGRLIEQLDSAQFAKRQAASQKLFEAGVPAIEPLREAARGESREVTVRAIEVLKRHAMTGGETAKDAAREALNKLAQGEHKFAARAAQEALKPRPEDLPKNRVAPAVPNALPGIQLGGNGQIQIQVQGLGNAAGGRRIHQVQNKNGNKRIVVEEANRNVRIEETAGGAIKLEITETKDGKATTKKFEAKNEDELKQKHPEAHKVYQEFQQQGGNIQIGIGGMRAFGPNGIQGPPGMPIPGLPPNLPGMPNAIPPAPAAPGNAPAINPRIVPPRARVADPDLRNLNDAQRQLDAALERFRRLPPDANPNNPEFKKALEEIDRAHEQLGRLKKKLEEPKAG